MLLHDRQGTMQRSNGSRMALQTTADMIAPSMLMTTFAANQQALHNRMQPTMYALHPRNPITTKH